MAEKRTTEQAHFDWKQQYKHWFHLDNPKEFEERYSGEEAL